MAARNERAIKRPFSNLVAHFSHGRFERMAEPRKVFRIEQMHSSRPKQPGEADQSLSLGEITQELSALRALLAKQPSSAHASSDVSPTHDTDRLTGELRLIQAALTGTTPADAEKPQPAAASVRILSEIEATVAGSEQAAQKILAAAEDIDQAANNLSAALKNSIEQGLAQDIRDRVIHIFEACNYQDLTSQRLAKIIAALARIERQIAGALNEPRLIDAAPPANGPRLPQDSGHLSQDEIDAIFAGEIKIA